MCIVVTLWSLPLQLLDFGVTKKNLVVYIFLSFICLLVVIFAICPMLQLKLPLQLTIGVSEAVVLALTVMCSVEMVLLVSHCHDLFDFNLLSIVFILICEWLLFQTVLGDFCVTPTDNIRSLVKGTSFSGVVNYYSSCDGSNPLQSTIDSAQTALSALNQTLHGLTNSTGPCQGDSYLLDAITLVPLAQADYDSIVNQFACVPIRDQYDSLINKGFCTQFVDGFFNIWIAQYVTSGLLFALICLASVLYQYYGQAWKLDFTNIDAVPEHHEHQDDHGDQHHVHPDHQPQAEHHAEHHAPHADNHHHHEHGGHGMHEIVEKGEAML